MGFGNSTSYIPKEPPDPTFGALRADFLGFSVRCRRCAHERFICRKSSRFLASRLPDDLRLSQATRLFRCVACSHNIVVLTPENPYRASVALLEVPDDDARSMAPRFP